MQVLQKGKIIMLKAVIYVLLEVLMLVRVVILSDSEDSIAPNSFQEECSMCPNQTLTQVTYSADLAIEIPDNLNQNGSWYRLDYSPPVGFPPPNTTIAATEIGDVVKFKGLPGTRYEYWLYYSNSTLHDYLTWTASITTPPDPPRNLTVSVQNGTTAIVYWSPPVQGNYSGFLLRTQSFNDIQNLKTKVIPVDSVSYTFGNLFPGATYSLQLFTVLDVKESVVYISRNFTTKPNTPEKFIVWFDNGTVLLVQWQPLYLAGIYAHYKVSIDPPDTIESVLYVKHENEFAVAQAIFKGLVPGRAYNISVQTITENETSAPLIAQYRTRPLPPLNVTLDKSSITSTSFCMFWNPPNGTSEFDMYQISLASNRNLAPIRRNRHDKNKWKFKNLQPGNTYEVVVKTVSGNTTSLPTRKSVTLKPLPVYDLRAIDEEADQVTVVWTPESSSIQDSYKLQYHEVETTIGGDSNTLTTNITKVSLTLLPGRNYFIIVQAISNKAESNEAVLYQATSPASPVIEYVKPIEKGFNISWKNNVNSKQEKYEVIYKSDDTDTSVNVTLTESHIVLRDLYPGALYQIEIFAISHGLRSKPKDFVVCFPPLPPKNVSIEKITSNTIVMYWEASTDSIFTNYLVRYRTQDDHSWIKSLNVRATEVKVDMTPGERYIIQVNTVSHYVESLHSLQMNYTIRPNPVSNINSYQIINSTNLILEWLRPKGRIEGYFIRWWPINNLKDKRTKNVSETNDSSFNENAVQIREVLLDNLMLEEQYVFIIHTVSYGIISDIGNLTTKIKYIPEYFSSKPTSPRAFVEFHNRFISKTDISVTFRWNQPEFTHDLIQGYTVQCWFIKNQDMIPICNEKNIPVTKLENTVQNLTSNTTYYFRVRAHTKIGVSPYTDLNVSTTNENPIPQLLTVSNDGIDIWDLDLKTNKTTISVQNVLEVAYSIAEHKIYWIDITRNLMTWEMNENNITKIARLQNNASNLCIDWVARNLYWKEFDLELYRYVIMKLDLTMWQDGIVKFDKILISPNFHRFTVLPFIGIVYWNLNHIKLMQLDFDGKHAQIFQTNTSYICYAFLNALMLSRQKKRDFSMKIDNTNIEKPLIYWTSRDYVIVTDVYNCIWNFILNVTEISYERSFNFLTIDKTNIYISTDNNDIYVLRKKYARLKSVNAFKYIQKIKISYPITRFYAFGKSLQSYPPTRCLTPKEKVYNIKIMEVMTDSIIVNFTEPVRKNGCEEYNLPTTLYTIHISHCLDNGFNKFKKFKVQTYERYYEIQNLTPLTEYELQLNLSNFYVDRLSMNPILGLDDTLFIRTKPGKLNAPENITVQILTSTIMAVQWMPPKKLNCVPVTFEVHWKSLILLDRIPHMGEQVIKMPQYTADGMFFTKIQLLSAHEYLIYVRVYPSNFSDFYNDSSSKTIRTYLEPNNVTLSGVSINTMNISWIPSTNLAVLCALKYKNDLTENWHTTNNIKVNYKEKVTFYIKNLQPETSYQFRLMLRYLEYEENFTWPSDGRFTFSTLGDISSTPGMLATQYYSPLTLIITGIVIVVIVFCVCYFYYLHRKRKEGNEQVLPPIITDIQLASLDLMPTKNIIQFNTSYGPMSQCNLNKLMKIKREQITITELLGSGAFGEVYQGRMKNLENPSIEMPVAIKMLRRNASLREKEKFLEEVRLMNRFRYKHVLRLLAVCSDEDSPLLVLELMETDLLKYLRESRTLQPSDSHALRLQDLLAMCEDVARGCCYLEKLRFVHRDLACRNCLISSKDRENRVVKIGDFGLTRDIYRDDYYRMKGGLVPICWMAPESLTTGKFTSQSDVWSFGVLMWEITSLGEQPYTGRTNVEVVDYVRTGGRLPMPLNCPSELYQLMMHCWNAENARPNFKLCLENIIALKKDIEDALLHQVDNEQPANN
ncbi:proto-oncogene tyrosine-protein kinase ROS-like [Anoplolepis gracilipes]|uniref:proto-oncogene tyrosine-protein kinase ROS-like n=1 Tax=Anoplolepis gracilipes TaxID=354296 RepID=UPI003BA1C8A3